VVASGKAAIDSASKAPDSGDEGPNPALRNLVGALTVSQTVLTALGAANGSLGAVALNGKRWWIPAGLALIFAGVSLGLWGQLKQRPWAQITSGLLLTSVVLATAYAVLLAPTKSSSPIVDAELLSTRPLLLRGEVKATGIKRGELFQVVVNGLDLIEGQYQRVGPALYHGVLGADSSGEIEANFKIPIHRGGYEAVAVIAWSHTKPPQFCGFSKDGSFELPEVQDIGCALIYLGAPNAGTTLPAAPKVTVAALS
jgi:hypothetical protein